MATRLRSACAFGLLLASVLPGVVQAQFSYTATNGTISITGYTGPGGAVTIPDSISNTTNGLPVTSIGDYAFSGCTSLASVTIPQSVTNIGVEAFTRCSRLTAINVDTLNSVYSSVGGVLFDKSQTKLVQYPGGIGGGYTIPSSVTSIGDWAFAYCSRLVGVTIGNRVTSIGEDAFYNCTGLASATILNSVTNLGTFAFAECTSLASLTIDISAIPDYAFNDGYGLTSVTMGNSVTSIGDEAFEGCTSLASITIPNSVTSIGEYAFLVCMSLASVTIPNSVTNIGEQAFAYCTQLTHATIGSSVTSIGNPAFLGCGRLAGITVNPQNAFYSGVGGVLFDKGQTTLVEYPGGLGGSYAIPNGVTSIGDSAFASCSNLFSVTIPDSVLNLGDSAFLECSSLTNVAIPNSVTNIGDSVFVGCANLTSVTIDISVPNTVGLASLGCHGLTSVTIGSSATNIGYWTFAGCGSLAAITVDALSPFYSSVAGVLFDKGQTTLIACPEAKTGSYTIPNGVGRIGDNAFKNCSYLLGVTIPNSVTNIGDCAFFECYELAGAAIPNAVTSIGNCAFYYCGSLSTLTIPNSVTTIGTNAFQSCYGLTNVTIGNSVASIGSEAFDGCDGLTGITVQALNSAYCSVEGVLFDKSQTTLIQYPPARPGPSYTIPTTVTSIGDSSFYGCGRLTGVTIPNNVTNIAHAAFSRCPALANVYFQGNAPSSGPYGPSVFEYWPPTSIDGPEWDPATIYYLPGTTGWGPYFAGLPTVLWNAQVQTSDASFGVRTNRFGFTITGTSNLTVVVEASSSLAAPVWTPVQTNALLNGSSYFSDPEWENYRGRFYRLARP